MILRPHGVSRKVSNFPCEWGEAESFFGVVGRGRVRLTHFKEFFGVFELVVDFDG